MTTLSPQDLQEEQELAEMLEELGEAGPSDFATASGALPKGEGLMQDVSDPTRLVPVYRTLTGEMEMVPAWTLQGQNSILRYREPDGTRRFNTKPQQVFERGKVPCRLSAAHPLRQKYRDMGIIRVGALANCVAEHLGSLQSERVHMQNCHKQEWATIQEAERIEREDEQRDWQRLQAEAARQSIEANTPKRGRQSGGE